MIVEGDTAQRTVTVERKDENGTSSSVPTRRFLVEGKTCVISD